MINVGTNIDHGAIFSGYLGLMLVGAMYAAIGIFFSSFTNNQVIALIASATLSFAFFLVGKILILKGLGFLNPFLIYSIIQLNHAFHP